MLKFLNILFLNENYFYLSLVVFLISIWLLKRGLFKTKYLKLFLITLISFVFLFAFLKTVVNYFVWLNDPLSKNLLPPYTPISYFLRYSFQHYFFSAIVTIIFASLIFWLIIKFNKKFEEKFFYEEEPYLASIGILLTGWPNCLFYLTLVLFLGVVSHFLIIIFAFFLCRLTKKGSLGNAQTAERAGILSEAKKSEAVCASSEIRAGDFGTFSKASFFRLSLLYFWLPCALLVLILNDIISKWSLIQYFII